MAGIDEIKSDIQNIDTALTATNTTVGTISTNIASMATGVMPNDLGSTTSPFSGCNATAVAAAATPQQIVAAAGASKSYYITKIIATNPTTAESAVLILQDEDDTALAVVVAANRDDATAGHPSGEYTFYPPIKTAANKALEVACIGDIGDSFMTIVGYVDD